MTFYPVVYPIHMGDDNDVLLFSDVTDGVQEAAYDTCYNTNQNLLTSPASTVSNVSEMSSSYPASPLMESSSKEMPQTFEFQSSANSPESFHHSRHGSIEGDETWGVNFGESSARFSASAPWETFTTQQVASRGDPLSATSQQEIRNHVMAYTPLDFVPSAYPSFSQLMPDSAFLADTASFWAPPYIIQESSLDHPEQGLDATQCLPPVTSSKRSTTSTATQTSDDLVVDSTPLRACSPPTLSSPVMTKTNLTRPASRNFPCNIDGCPRSYTRKFELSRHLKRHSGSKEHHCRFLTCAWAAPNGFTRKDHLKQHLRQVHKTSA